MYIYTHTYMHTYTHTYMENCASLNGGDTKLYSSYISGGKSMDPFPQGGKHRFSFVLLFFVLFVLFVHKGLD